MTKETAIELLMYYSNPVHRVFSKKFINFETVNKFTDNRSDLIAACTEHEIPAPAWLTNEPVQNCEIVQIEESGEKIIKIKNTLTLDSIPDTGETMEFCLNAFAEALEYVESYNFPKSINLNLTDREISTEITLSNMPF